MPKHPQGSAISFVEPPERRTYFVIGPKAAAELRELYEELPVAAMRAAETLRTNGMPLEGEALRRFFDEEADVAEIIRRIRAVLQSPGKS
jgi:hypothetical protein